MRLAGQVLDPWQCDIVNVMSAVRPDGKWQCYETAEIVPRQNGKGAVLEARALGGLFLFRERLVMWSAHQTKTAFEAFIRVKNLINNLIDAGELDGRDIKENNTNGEEGFEIRSTGQRLKFLARSKSSGRGFSGDCNIWDEAFALSEEQVAAQMPTLRARPNPQIIYASSPPLDAVSCQPLFDLRERGEAGDDPDLAWFDWGQLPGVDHDDPLVWAAANPALGIRITLETMGRERKGMSKESFGRELLGIWPLSASVSVISPKLWAELAAPDAVRPDDVSFQLDVTPNRDHASIAFCGRLPDGHLLTGIADHGDGTDWVIKRLVELREKWNPISIGVDNAGPAAALLPELDRNGFRTPADPEKPKRGDLVVCSPTDTAKAWGMWVDAVRQSQLYHLDDEPLNFALRNAKTRYLADGQAWARKTSDVDISPLCASTGALYSFITRVDAICEEEAPAPWVAYA